MSFCVRIWGCDTCMLLSGHFCSFLMRWWNTPCNIMVLLRLTHVVAWTGRVMQCTVTACTLLWLVATRDTAHSFAGSMLFNLGRGSRRLTECSWADNCTWADSWVDNLQLSWQPSWQIAPVLTNCMWADSQVDNLKMSWADKFQLSCQTVAKQTVCVWNKLKYSTWSWQSTEELKIVYRLADRLHSSWQSAVELTDCDWFKGSQPSWESAFKLSWQIAARAGRS